MSPAYQMNDSDLVRYHEDGYLIVEGLFDSEEIGLLYKVAKADQELSTASHGRKDSEGRVSKLTLRYDLTDDLYSAFMRTPRIVEPLQKMLKDEIYHFHHKMMLKEPRVGGAWEWHQDYGYWYDQGFLCPMLASCMIAVDGANRENGCLQVLRGSHRMGRIEHGQSGDQTGADMTRVESAIERFELVYVEMKPGSAVFFDSNLLHRSDANQSDQARWTLIGCYNAAGNVPYSPTKENGYKKLVPIRDDELIDIARREWAALGAPA